ncbi:dihydrolipoamide acetyltransferase component of pyruvate dehydrogenase complex [Zafaria cholistanensis]|uniref:Dihydrolipoamide acetyltransferase component of pyruvate dehydrogenase complex n=1 Tax=Zafaria cholistanensis TaxID=1682741 RepID=A0A5A7NRW0_9MICC|nr:dihydrolipoamide acetyltransferase family protein [Zafaria cholistanensis]GER22558.1 dihydrolipoamide acetyltransferase component of pyruvate dehydrogenase complex [Zafaria cholistanensis]
MTTVRKLFRLPDLGEGLTDSEIVAWRVAVGDSVALNQTLADVETAKAVVELPSPYAGTVAELFADPGALVEVGSPLIAFDVPDEAGEPGTAARPGSASPGSAAPDSADQGGAGQGSGSAAGTGPSGAGGTAPAGRRPTLVGYGAEPEPTGHPVRRPRRGRPAATGAAAGQPPAGQAHAGPHLQGDRGAVPGGGPEGPESEGGPGERPRSTPPVRKLAHDLGVDLSTVTGTGDHGLITRADIEAAHHAAVRGAGAGHPGPGQAAPEKPLPEQVTPGQVTPEQTLPEQPLPGQAASGQVASGQLAAAPPRTFGGRPREERIPIHGVRMRTAAAVSASAFTAPHITEFLTVDATAGMKLLGKLRQHPAFADAKPTPLALAAKAVCLALEQTPALNARWDQGAGQIVRFNYVNLGIAAATPRGLLVPNIKDAQALGLADLARSLAGLAESARAGTTTPHELTGGTFTITNVGVFGVDAGTPILNPGEAGILALGQVARRPWDHRGKVALRDVVTLSLSVDHRVVDGEEASRFLVDVGTILSDPAMLIAML